MPNYKRIPILTAALLTLSMWTTVPAWADGSHYVGIGFGGFNIGNGIEKKTGLGGYLQLGHDFNDWMGAEIRLGATSSVNTTLPTPAKQRIDFVAHFLKPYFEVSSDVIIYGLVGFAVTHNSYQPAIGVKQTKNRISYAYGLGMEYELNRDYSAGFDVWHMNGKPNNTTATIGTAFDGLEASTFTAAIRYRF